jgi:hypothetical protein
VTREAGILAGAVTAVPLLAGAAISVIPQLDGVWAQMAGVAVILVAIVVLAVFAVRSARRLLIGQSADTEIVAYTDNRETGVLLKGNIENVALRVSTIHRIVDSLACAIPSESRREALYKCGCEIGRSWAADFRRELPRLEIRRSDTLRQLIKWSEYDATAGMGRLTVAVDPDTGEGVVTLANGFLSRARAGFPLNWWFAGYLAGTLHELLDHEVTVEVVKPSAEARTTALFTVAPIRAVDSRPVARIEVWIRHFRRWRQDIEGRARAV